MSTEQQGLIHYESKGPGLLANGVSSTSSSIQIYLTDVCHPASANCRLKLITQCINGLGNGSAVVKPDVISDTEFYTHLKIIDIISIIGLISIITIICIRSIIVNYIVGYE
jgi:hypothetical protein